MFKYSDRAWNPMFGHQGGFAGCNRCYARGQMLKRGFCDDFKRVLFHTLAQTMRIEADTSAEAYDIAKKMVEKDRVH